MTQGMKKAVKPIKKILYGLLGAQWSLSAANPAQAIEPNFTVIGVDRTEDYIVMTQIALGIATDYIKQAKLGDEVIIRWISDRSYDVDQSLTHLRVPTVKLPRVKNRFDGRNQRLRAKLERRLKLVVGREKARAVEDLRADCVGPTAATDLIGFVAAAAELLAEVPAGVNKQLVMATDLNDNRGFKVDPDLSGTQVAVYILKGPADPATMQAKKADWAAQFKQWGASGVEFIRPNQTQLNWRNEQCGP